MLYSIDITFRNGGIANFGIESDQSDSYVTRRAPIAKRTVENCRYNIQATITEYLRRGATVQKLTPQGWINFESTR